MNQNVELHFDDDGRTLYVSRTGSRVWSSEEAPEDPELVINYDTDRRIVGLILLGADQVQESAWERHPDLGSVPADLRGAVLNWIRNRHHMP